ncbi:MAG: WYL domain-containing protein [Lachnospiraceae bacterium]|nr:WYL domain-containing protein [Lachnospiraceae bacterium]
MSKNNENAIYRLNTILTLFQVEGVSYSVKELAELLQIPASVIRKDILMLHTHDECGITFFAEEEDGPEDIAEALKSEKADDLILGAITQYENEVYLPLTELEISCLNDFLDGKQLSAGKVKKNYTIKPMYNQARANMQVKVKEMYDVIQKGQNIRIKYKTRTGAFSEWLIRPLELIHNAMDDLYYVVTVNRGRMIPYRLDRIRSYRVVEEDVEVGNTEVLKHLPHMWGMELGEKVHVKIKILNEANVQYKVKRDLAQRIHGTWTQVGDDLYFEDDVIGIYNFKSWINSYGSSVLVVEPESLRKEIMESARKRIAFYEE